MSTSAAAAAWQIPLDQSALGALLAKAVVSRPGPVRLIGSHLHDLAARLIADGVPVQAGVPNRRDARVLRRAARRAGGAVPPPTVGGIDVDLPFPDADLGVVVCRLEPRTFPFPRHTVRELGRIVAPDGWVVLLPGDRDSWPAGLVDAWAAAAGLAPPSDRDPGGGQPFTGAVYRPRP